jgi:hypothetical protein
VAIDTMPLRSRRAILAGSLGALGALAAQAIGRPLVTTATDGDVVKVGDNSLTATSATKITNTANPDDVIWGASKSGVGIRGSSATSFGGSFTTATRAGVRSSSGLGTGVLGISSTGSSGLPTGGARVGVHGFADRDATSVGVRGESSIGLGVFGYFGPSPAPAPTPSRGVYAFATGSSTGTIAIEGESDTGRGIRGRSGGGGTGVYGQSVSGVGVVGRVAPLTSDISVLGPIGVAGLARVGVKGSGLDDGGGIPVGVEGVSASIGIFGRSGFAPPPSADPVGVWGISSQSADGVGVKGESDAGIGVRGESDNIAVSGSTGTGVAVDGLAGSDSGAGIGVRGRTEGATGIGVLGICDPEDPDAVAVKGTGSNGVLGTTAAGVGVKGIATTGAGFAGVFQGKVSISRFVDLDEIPTPGAPAADTARLFVRDDGSGKTQVCVRFNGGQVVVLASQA